MSAIEAVITWLVARYYYQKATRDLLIASGELQSGSAYLLQETERLRGLVNIHARALHHANAINATFDSQGELTGFSIPSTERSAGLEWY